MSIHKLGKYVMLDNILCCHWNILTICRRSEETICMQHIAVAKAQTMVEMILRAHTLNNRSCEKTCIRISSLISGTQRTGNIFSNLIINAVTCYQFHMVSINCVELVQHVILSFKPAANNPETNILNPRQTSLGTWFSGGLGSGMMAVYLTPRVFSNTNDSAIFPSPSIKLYMVLGILS